MAAGIAEGRRVLVVEDEFTIVLPIEDALLDLGIQVIGPASRLDAALCLAREAQIDAAMLDINILGGNSYTVADILVERGIRFFLCTGYSDWALEERHRNRPRLAKPFSSKGLQNQVLGCLIAAGGLCDCICGLAAAVKVCGAP